MPPAGKNSDFYRKGNDWFCSSRLASDIVVTIDDVSFHLHKFPLMSRCGRIVKIYQKLGDASGGVFTAALEGFPGGADNFLTAAKFCYGLRLELTPRDIVMIYCASDYLEMTNEYGEDNLLSKCEAFFHKSVLRNWKDCILALQGCEPVVSRSEKLQILSKCLDTLSIMACTDPSLFGWPMMMYGSLQSPGGSILWNGINTGARIRSVETDWWFEDISYLSVGLFGRLIRAMITRGIRPENIAGAIMYYARKYLPGVGRWSGGQTGQIRTVASFSLMPAEVDQRGLLESIEKLLPEKKGKSFCRFLLGLLRVALILGVDQTCKSSLEGRIGMQLDLATVDGLLIPTYSYSDTLYDIDCIERIVNYFLSSVREINLFSPSSVDIETSPSSGPQRRVAKLIDSYLAEVASDVNLKPEKLRSFAEALPDSSRVLHDGLYRVLDIYFKAHPWLSEKEKEQLCNIIDYQKLSIDACAHASHNDRLPLRVVLQVLFFEQMHMRTALAGCLQVLDTEAVHAGASNAPDSMAGQVVQRDDWVTLVRENRVLKVDMEKMRSRVVELEGEFSKIKEEVKRVSKSHSSLNSPHLVGKKLGCKLVPKSSDAQGDLSDSRLIHRRSVEQGHSSRHSLSHRRSLSHA